MAAPCQAIMLGDQNQGGIDSNTLLLWHADGTNASTTFTDVSPSGRTLTANGNAQVSTAQSVFGGASALFDGTGDYISAPDSASWAFGSGSFTVDCWWRPNSLAASNGLFGQWTDGNNGMRLFAISTGSIQFDLWSGGTNTTAALVSATGQFSTATWYHIAIVRNVNAWNIYKNGVSIASASVSQAVADYTGAFIMGSNDVASNCVNGWIDEFRVSNVARWTTTFTPPAMPYTY